MILLIFKRVILKIYSRNLYFPLCRIMKSRVVGFGSSYIFEYHTTRKTKTTNNTFLPLTITPAIVFK